VRLVLAEHDKNIWIAGVNIEALAEQGDLNAQLTLGWHYYVGYGVAQDRSVAVKWYEKAARAGLPEAERLLELISAECDRPSIAGLVIGGQPSRSMWKLAGRGLFLVVILAAVVSISYYFWPKHQQPLIGPENDVIQSDQHIPAEKEPNIHVDKAGTSTEDIELVHPVTIEPEPDELPTSAKEIRPIVEVTEQEAIVDSNSSVRDPNFIPIPKSKSIIEELAEIGDKWLEKLPNETD